MPEYSVPGVYVEEISSGPQPIPGVGTSTAGFLGQTERGPESPQFITSWSEFQRIFGSYVPDKSYLAYAVQGFFDNGGQRCFVGRIASENATYARTAVGGLQLAAVGRGKWGNDLYIHVAKATQAEHTGTPGKRQKRVQISVFYGGDQPANLVERYDNLTDEAGASNNIVNTLNANSHFIRAWWPGGQEPGAPNVTKKAQQFAGGTDGDDVTVDAYHGSIEVLPSPADNGPLLGNEIFGRGTGFAAFAKIGDIALLVMPDEVRDGFSKLTTEAINQCEQLKDRFAIVSAPLDAGEPAKIVPPVDTSFAAYYYPWIRVYDPSIDDTRLVPPGGHIAGIFARIDVEHGVWKAPANMVIAGAVNLQKPVTAEIQNLLNPRGVNCLRDFRTDGRGLRVWGARTMSSDPEWKYISVRRLFIYLQQSIYKGTEWVVFEPNNDTTWRSVVQIISNFLAETWRAGALMGATADEAFFVKCDRTTMTQNDIDNGRLICYIGVAPLRPAEFVIFRIGQKTAEAVG